MRLQVIPIRRMPINLPHLDYLPGDFEDDVMVGQLVTIPFRNKKEYGIIQSISETSDIGIEKLKKISSLITREPIIPSNLINFNREISEFYRTPIGFLLKSALLPLKKSKLEKIEKKLIVVDEASAPEPQKPLLVLYQDLESRNKIIAKIASERGQALVLVPEVGDIEPMCQILGASLAKKPLAVSGEIGDKDYFDIWLNVRSDKNAVVVGTRKALFLPWINLENILMEDEGNPDYKSWDMAPRFHARDAALMLSKHTSAKLYLMSAAPSVDSYFFAKQHIYDTAGQAERIPEPGPIFIDALREQQSSKNGHIGSDIIDALSEVSGDAFILINRRGTSSAVICKDCGHIFSCSNCRRPMTYFDSKNKLICSFCGESKPLSAACPYCSGPSFRMISPGAEGIAAELKKILPKKRIISIEKDDRESLKLLKFPGSKIIVGTKFAWYHLNWSRTETLVFADPDTTLALPEYRATEFLWQFFRQSQLKIAKDSKLYIQTSKPEHHIYQGLYNPAVFYETELTERRVFGYPPYNYIVRLILSASPDIADRESIKIFKKLQTLTQPFGDVKINGPFSAQPPVLRGKSYKIIILKLSFKNYKQRLKEIAKSIPEEWKIDPNPNNLLSII